jgi:hypothetical protein
MLPLKINSPHDNYAPTGIMKAVQINFVNYLTYSDNNNANRFSKNRLLNPDFSNLQDAGPKFPSPSLAEIISNTQLGIYGSTEVKSNQIW